MLVALVMVENPRNVQPQNRGVTYKIREQQGDPAKHLRVTFHRQDLESMRFESGDGANLKPGETVVWERRDFLPPDFFSASIVEGGNLYASLSQRLEIGRWSASSSCWPCWRPSWRGNR